jgi:mRNA interferase RelE/StbE
MYAVELKPSAVRDIKALPHSVQKRVGRKIDALARDPYPPGSVKLEAVGNFRRVRVGAYRIIYQVRQQALVVFVVRVRHRGDAYRP